MPFTDVLSDQIQRLSGAAPRFAASAEVQHILGYDIASMRDRNYDPSIIQAHEAFNSGLIAFLEHPIVREYLTTLTPHEVYLASGVRVLPLKAIRDEITSLAPCVAIFPFGYIPIATSIGGHAICVSIPSGEVVWADQGVFAQDGILDPSADTFELVPLSRQSIGNAVRVLAPELGGFMRQLLAGELQSHLDVLDSGAA